VLLGLVLLLIVNVGVILANTSGGHSIPTVALIVVVALVALVLLLFLLALRIVVQVVSSPEGPYLRVAYGPGGLVRQVFPVKAIVSASVEDVSFLHSGGWGYRGSLVVVRRATLATRRGAALQLVLSRGRRFTVTVDAPEAFVLALQAR
jgi:hypothetical protein